MLAAELPKTSVTPRCGWPRTTSLRRVHRGGLALGEVLSIPFVVVCLTLAIRNWNEVF
ncbi:hypothetical protein HBB16_06465, partial [Pseudonocardia sp. MCCB 268]|nr:hypothetical protein [Pseudonocardia cytotoxica]